MMNSDEMATMLRMSIISGGTTKPEFKEWSHDSHRISAYNAVKISEFLSTRVLTHN